MPQPAFFANPLTHLCGPVPIPTLPMFHQVTLALVVASTSMVQASMRGKLGGLYYTTESLGRFIGPMGFATMFAWSISPSTFDWVDHNFVFLMSAIAMVLITILAWGTITDENVLIPARRGSVTGTPSTRTGDREQQVVISHLQIPRQGEEVDLV